MVKSKIPCTRCQKSFLEKDIYTIQQFQYRKKPSYEWSLKYFEKLNIDEWTSFCQDCMLILKEKSHDSYLNELSS